ncbi:MAG: inositol monophosphatase family protein [Halobacteriota archaeon]
MDDDRVSTAEDDRVSTADDDRVSIARAAAELGGEIALASFRSDLAVETKTGVLDSVTAVDRRVQREITSFFEKHTPTIPVIGEENDAPSVVPDTGPAWIVDPIDGTNNYVAGNRVWAVSIAATIDGDPVAAVTALPALGETYLAGSSRTVRESEPAGSPRIDSSADDRTDDARVRDRTMDARDCDPPRREPVGVSDRTDPAAFTIAPVFGLADEHQTALLSTTDTIVTAFGDVRRAGSAHATLAGVASGELDAAVSTVDLHPWDTVGGVHLVRQAGGTVTDLQGDRWRHDSTGLVASNDAAHETLVTAFGDR